MLVQAAWSAIKAQGRLQAKYHKLVRRFGGPKNPAASCRTQQPPAPRT